MITNTTVHTIGEYDRTVPVGIVPKNINPTLKVQPNPFGESTLLELQNYTITEVLQLRVYDALGRLQRVEKVESNRHVFQRGALPSGIYYYQLETSEKAIASGKLVVD